MADALRITWRCPSLNIRWRGPNNQILAQPAASPPARIATAVAPSGRDGASFGFRLYGDGQYTSAAPLTLQADTPTILTLNDAGFDVDRYEGGWSGFDALQAGEFVPRVLAETFALRVNCFARSSAINNRLVIQLDIGGTQNVIDVDEIELRKTTERRVSFKLFGFALETFLTNRGTFIATADSQVELYDFSTLHLPLGAP